MGAGQSSATSSLFWARGTHDASVVGGFDRTTRKKLLVARMTPTSSSSSSSDVWVPGYVAEGGRACHVAHYGRAETNAQYETLVNAHDVYLEWVVQQGDRIPTGAVVAHGTDSEQRLIGRGLVDGDWVPGVLVPVDQADSVFVAVGSSVMQFGVGKFEVLCVNTVTPASKA